MNSQPIGVFDSGMGGLTVLKALDELLPQESFLYLGDTARLPYGTKSPETVIQYAQQATHILKEHGVKILIVACNTASSVALEALQHQFDPIPVVGVLLPGAAVAAQKSQSGVIGVIATEATIAAGGYERAILKSRPDASVHNRACSLFVPLAEEGWAHTDIAEAVARKYLTELSQTPGLDCLVLGCTHFPILEAAISSVMGAGVTIVDSAHSTADVVKRLLEESGALSEGTEDRKETFFVTDGPERFSRVAQYFLGRTIASKHVEPIKINGNRQPR